MGIRKITTRRNTNSRDQRVIEALLNHVVDRVRPRRVYLVGSFLSGTVHENSDIDFVIVSDEDQRSLEAQSKLFRARPHIDRPVDFICVQTKEFDSMKDIGGICFEAHHHGKLLFSADQSQ